ncbi:hypothetical protein T190820D02B_40267 [Tenacibaculum sp. 190524A05c]
MKNHHFLTEKVPKNGTLFSVQILTKLKVEKIKTSKNTYLRHEVSFAFKKQSKKALYFITVSNIKLFLQLTFITSNKRISFHFIIILTFLTSYVNSI